MLGVLSVIKWLVGSQTAELLNGHFQRAFGRVSDLRELALLHTQLRVVADRCHIHDIQESGRVLLELCLADLSVLFWGVRGSFDVVADDLVWGVANMHDLDSCHLVGGESSGLVGADDSGAAEGLDGGEFADDGVVLGHFLRAERKAGGDDGGQAFGDRGDGEGNSDFEVVNAAVEDGAVHGVPEVADVDDPDDHADDHDDFGEVVSEFFQFDLERGLLGAALLHFFLDLSDLGLEAGLRHNGDTRSVVHDSRGKDHILFVLNLGVRVVQWRCLLQNGPRLAGESALVHLEGD